MTVVSFPGHYGLPTPELALYQEHTTISVTEVSQFLATSVEYTTKDLRQADISYEHFKWQLKIQMAAENFSIQRSRRIVTF